MSKQAVKIDLDAAEVADLDAVAAECGLSRGQLAAEIVVQWISGRWGVIGATVPTPDAKRQEARRRFAILHGWIRAKRPRKGADGYSSRTLYVWEKAWQDKGVPGLVDRRGMTRPTGTTSGPFLSELRRRFIRSPRLAPTMAKCHREAIEVAKAKGWSIVSLRTAQNYLRGLSAKAG